MLLQVIIYMFHDKACNCSDYERKEKRPKNKGVGQVTSRKSKQAENDWTMLTRALLALET